MIQADHCQDVLSGIYDLPIEFDTRPPIILDIGANVGAFAVWASQRWPGCCLFCFEPVQANYDLLMDNTAHIQHCLRRNVGVRLCKGQMQIAEGTHNCGEWTTKTGVNDLTGNVLLVPCIAANELPKADLLKIDTEGCEVEILQGLKDAGRLGESYAVMLEWHSESDRLAIDALLSDQYQLCGAHCTGPERGTAKYVLKRLVKGKKA